MRLIMDHVIQYMAIKFGIEFNLVAWQILTRAPKFHLLPCLYTKLSSQIIQLPNPKIKIHQSLSHKFNHQLPLYNLNVTTSDIVPLT